LTKYKLITLAAVIVGLLCAAPARAQNISIVTGNGKLFCGLCLTFQNMTVKVTDSNGAPIPNTPVNWAITAGGYNALLLAGNSNSTDANGLATNLYVLSGNPQQGSPFQQFVQNAVTASTAASSVTFILNEALFDPTNPSIPPVNAIPPLNSFLSNLLAGQVLSGQAGTAGSQPLQIRVAGTAGIPIPNVSFQLVNYQDPSVGPVVNCATTGGQANTVLSDATGVATCTPVFGGVPGSGNFSVLVGGGGIPPADPTNVPNTVLYSSPLKLTVTPAPAGLIKKISGDSQSVNPSKTSASMVAEVDTTSGTPIAGAQVNWSVSPAGAGSLLNPTTTSDINGRVSNGVVIPSTATGGTVTVTATLSTDSTKSVAFTVTVVPPITVSGVQVVSGNNQTAIINTAFGAPLVVQVNASSGQASGVPVQFTATGPVTLSANSATTNSSGQAQITVTAGGTPGAATITASASGFSASFSLTVSPAGPSITATSFVNGADFQVGSISPCSIASIIAPGLAPGIQGVVAPNYIGAWQYKVANDTVFVNGSAAPIFSVSNVNGQEQLTFQVPCDAPGGSNAQVTVNVGAGNRTVTVPIQPASPGVFQELNSDGVLRTILVRPDGSFATKDNPARRGESVIAFITGLGPTSPAVATNQLPVPGTPANAQGTVIVGMNGGGLVLNYARLVDYLLGVFEVSFQIPSDMVTGDNVTFSIGLAPQGSSNTYYSSTTKVPVQ